MEIIFEKPEYLWFIIAIPIIVIVHFITLKSTNRKAIKFANFEAIERITGGETLSKNFFLLFIRVLIVLLFVFALSSVSISYVGQGSNFDFAIAIDSSNSMLIEDLQPSRLYVAKESTISFIDSLTSNNDIAIISFSSNALLESELTADLSKAKNAVRNINAEEIGGTSLGDAVISSVNSLILSKNSKIIILVTDGRSNTGVDVEDAVEYAKLKQAIINTIGIGTEGGGEYIEGVNLTLDESTLREISSDTGGKYFRAASSESLNDAYKEIAGNTETIISKNLTVFLTLISLFLLLIEWILFNTKYRTIP